MSANQTNNSAIPNLTSNSTTEPAAETTSEQLQQIRFVPHIALGFHRSLHFDVIDREVSDKEILKVGRHTDKVPQNRNRITFRSKVVSRAHAEIWAENGQFFLKDTKSSSGTFLNQQRLSAPNQESVPYQLKDGDILQLGVDYQGGIQDVFRCVKMRLEINRSWQREQQNPFRLKALQNLETLKKSLASGSKLLSASGELEECCICLCPLAAFQALFVAPCSHTFHYKCLYRMLQEGPSFVCPLCRTYANLDAEVCTDEIDEANLISRLANTPTESNLNEEAGLGNIISDIEALNLETDSNNPQNNLEIPSEGRSRSPSDRLQFGEDRGTVLGSLRASPSHSPDLRSQLASPLSVEGHSSPGTSDPTSYQLRDDGSASISRPHSIEPNQHLPARSESPSPQNFVNSDSNPNRGEAASLNNSQLSVPMFPRSNSQPGNSEVHQSLAPGPFLHPTASRSLSNLANLSAHSHSTPATNDTYNSSSNLNGVGTERRRSHSACQIPNEASLPQESQTTRKKGGINRLFNEVLKTFR